jgi:aminodeoxyfutalosine deaminase
MDILAERRITLEVCPESNLKTGALARQFRDKPVRIEDHPLPQFLRHGIPVVLSTDDPAMFNTTLRSEYENAARMGLQETELTRIVEMSFQHAFSPADESCRT